MKRDSDMKKGIPILIFICILLSCSNNHELKPTEKQYMLAQLFEKQGKYEEAVDCIDSVLVLEPDNLVAFNARGWLLYNSGQEERAIKTFRYMLKKDTSCEQSYLSMGEVLARQKKYAKAKKYLDKAYVHYAVNQLSGGKDNHPVVDKGSLYYWVGFVSYLQGDFDQSGRALNYAVQEAGEYQASALQIRGELLLKTGEKQKACADFNKAAELGNKKALDYMKHYCK